MVTYTAMVSAKDKWQRDKRGKRPNVNYEALKPCKPVKLAPVPGKMTNVKQNPGLQCHAMSVKAIHKRRSHTTNLGQMAKSPKF